MPTSLAFAFKPVGGGVASALIGAPYGFASFDADLRLRWANAAFADLCGVAPTALVGATVGELLPTARPTLEDRAREALQGTGLVENVDFSSVGRENTTRYLRATIHAVRADDGIVRGGCCLITDATDEMRIVAERWQTQKLEATGHLANIFAHDFNNLLVVVQGYCDLLAMTSDDDNLKDKLCRIRSAGEAAAALSRQLLVLSRRNSGTVGDVDLNLLLRTMKASFERAMAPNVKKAFRFAEGLGLVRADPGQLDQIITNLLTNALDAMPDGGELGLITENVTVGADDAERRRLVAGEFVRLTVRDSGSGISDAVRGQLFEPGFTTKSPDDGAGLGLVTVRTMVRRLHGEIEVESIPGAGTSCMVWLPRVLPSQDARLAAKIPDLPAGAREPTILLVEFDDAVRIVIRDALARLGCQLLTAADAASALSVAAAHRGVIDALVARDTLPDLTGAALARAVLATRGGVRVLLTTAREGSDGIAPDTSIDGFPSLEMPFRIHHLGERLFRLLYPDRPAASG